MVYHPVEGIKITAKIRTLTKAGIHAFVLDKHGNTPLTIFVARDYNSNIDLFNTVKDDDTISVDVIGI